MNNAAIQEALFDRLNDILAIQYFDGDVPIYAEVPQPDAPESNGDFPYCTYGIDATTPFNTKDWVGTSILASVDIWSRQANFIEAKTISDTLWKFLDNTPLVLRAGATGETFMMTIVGADFMRDPDGLTKHGNLTIRILTADI